MFGYVDRDGDGYRELPDGKPLTVAMASTPTGRDRERDELWEEEHDDARHPDQLPEQKWPDLPKMGRAGKLQMWPVGWINTYGEGDAFMQLLYSKNIGQSNYSRFALPEFDELYRKSKRLPDGPERNARLPQDGRSSSPRTIRGTLASTGSSNTLVRPWVLGYKKHVNSSTRGEYLDVDRRAAEGRQVMPRAADVAPAARQSASVGRRKGAADRRAARGGVT